MPQNSWGCPIKSAALSQEKRTGYPSPSSSATASNGASGFVADTLRYETVDGVQIDFRNNHYDNGKLEAQTLERFEFTPVPPERFSPPR